MAQPFHELLEQLVRRHLSDVAKLECKHFFSGAALYVNGTICVSLTPVGLAFKLPDDLCSELIESGAAYPLKYFPKAPVKKGYALFPAADDLTERDAGDYFRQAVECACQKKV